MTQAEGPFRLGIVLDPPLERWTSMEYVGEMLLDKLKGEHAVVATALQPNAPSIFGRVPGPGRSAGHRLDRFAARCVIYPIGVALQRNHFDAFHIVDHSYSHVVHSLPVHRTGIFCHDLDALRPLFSRPYSSVHLRVLARSILRALERAALVFHSTCEVRNEIVAKGILDERKLVHAPYGVAPEFFPSTEPNPEFDNQFPHGPLLLYVGSDVPRKRVDLLLRSYALVCAQESETRLVIAGGPLAHENEVLLKHLGLSSRVIQFPTLKRSALAYFYRRADLLIAPSLREGFGLPVIEALACATRVLATDIPVFREVGGQAAAYVASAEPDDWAKAILHLLNDDHAGPSRQARLAQAALFTWSRHAKTILAAYRGIG